MPDLAGAPKAMLPADALPLPSVKQVAVLVPGRSPLDPVTHDRVVQGLLAVGRVLGEELVFGAGDRHTNPGTCQNDKLLPFRMPRSRFLGMGSPLSSSVRCAGS